MAPRIVRSLDAERDLIELFDYIAIETGVDDAEAVLRRIERTLDNLALFPRIGRIRADLNGSPRIFSVRPWLVVYEPSDDGSGIVVWRVVDGRRDVANLILGRPKR